MSFIVNIDLLVTKYKGLDTQKDSGNILEGMEGTSAQSPLSSASCIITSIFAIYAGDCSGILRRIMPHCAGRRERKASSAKSL